MGQRPRLVDFSSDPSAGRQFMLDNPIGYRKNGLPIFLMGGGSGEDEDDDDDESEKSTVPIARHLKVRNRMRAADQRASKAEAKVAELEPLVAKVPELEKRVESQSGTIRELRLNNAFLTASDVAWHDPETALGLADLSEVKIADDGTVTGLKEALAKLAEKKPFLVKPKADDDAGKGKKKAKKKDDDDAEDEEDEDSDEEDSDDEDDSDDDEDDDQDDDTSGGGGSGGGQARGRASGTGTGSGRRKKKSTGPSDAELMARYRI